MSYIKINNDNLVSEIIIDRSEALNAMNSDMLSELTKAMVKVKLLNYFNHHLVIIVVNLMYHY